jgi:hypothetical protein
MDSQSLTEIIKPMAPLPERETALARWDNEGGAMVHKAQPAVGLRTPLVGEPELGNAELVQLRVRVVALENVLVALLAQSSDEGTELARAMAAFISPRPGFTLHPITLHAAAQMIHLVGRAESFQAGTSDGRWRSRTAPATAKRAGVVMDRTATSRTSEP